MRPISETGTPHQPTTGSLSPPTRLLIADDHRMLRESLSRSFREAGFNVVATARNGAEAVRLTAQANPDVVVLDVSMPGLGGVQACRLILEQAPGTAVVMLSMHDDPQVLTNAFDAGAVGYVSKASQTSTVLAAVRDAANGKTTIPHQFVAAVQENRRTTSEERATFPLATAREAEVLQLVADGLTTVEIAASLAISEKTVKNHLASVYTKLGVHNKTHAVLVAIRTGLVDLAPQE